MTLDIVRQEVEGLHEFFVDWFTGACEGSDAVFGERFRIRFAPDCYLIPPNGRLMGFEKLDSAIHGDYGVNPDFRIAIRNVRVHRETGGLVLATYEEWQRNAVNSKPPDNGRIATVLFATGNNTATGLQWLHIHETWLPKDVMAAGPYDF